MRIRSQQGFGVVQALLLIIVLGMVGGTGWYVWHARGATKMNSTAGQSEPTPPTTTENLQAPAPDPTANWAPYSSVKGKFSLKYPKTWVQPVNKELCTPSLLERGVYLGPDASSVLHCATEDFGQMSVSSADGVHRTEANLDANYTNVIMKDVTIDGAVGQRISGVAAKRAPEATFGPIAGTIETHYVFYTGGSTYTARYTQPPTGTDVLSDFDLMITKTLKFSS